MRPIQLEKTLPRIRQLQTLIDLGLILACVGSIVLTAQLTEQKSLQKTHSAFAKPVSNALNQPKLSQFVDLPRTEGSEIQTWQALSDWSAEYQVHIGFCTLGRVNVESLWQVFVQCQGLTNTATKPRLSTTVWPHTTTVFSNKPNESNPVTVKTNEQVPVKPKNPKEIARDCPRPETTAPYGEYFLPNKTLIFKPKQHTWDKQP